MRKKDVILVIVFLLIAGVMYGAIHFIQKGEASTVKISVDGKVYGKYSINKDEIIDIKTSKGRNVINIHNGCVEMEEADCPDKYCIKQGKIKNTGQTIVCLPHKVVVEIIKQNIVNENNDVDAVVK